MNPKVRETLTDAARDVDAYSFLAPALLKAPAAYSGQNRPLIPEQIDHPFRTTRPSVPAKSTTTWGTAAPDDYSCRRTSRAGAQTTRRAIYGKGMEVRGKQEVIHAQDQRDFEASL